MPIKLALLKKVRCRFLDRSTGMPVPGVIASLSVAVGDGANSALLPVATLRADTTGYVSFDLKPLIDSKLITASSLYISAPQFDLRSYDLLESAPQFDLRSYDLLEDVVKDPEAPYP